MVTVCSTIGVPSIATVLGVAVMVVVLGVSPSAIATLVKPTGAALMAANATAASGTEYRSLRVRHLASGWFIVEDPLGSVRPGGH
jgi:hypothetical protein